jgi:large subunit ribosomal protein L23
MKLSSILLQPIITEKSVELSTQGVYVFKINMKANKYSVAKELKRMYGVDAEVVRTSILPGKNRRMVASRIQVRTPKWKKAIIKLAKGQTIDVFPKE